MFRPSHRICNTCSHRLLSIFTNDITHLVPLRRYGGKFFFQVNLQRTLRSKSRAFATQSSLKASLEDENPQNGNSARNLVQMEAIVRQARQIFGETLPENFLSEEEYLIYERLYGPPLATTLPEDVDLLVGNASDGANEVDNAGAIGDLPPNVLLREDKDGNLEEVAFEQDGGEDLDRLEEAEVESDLVEEVEEKTDYQFTEEEMMEELKRLEAKGDSEEINETKSSDQVIQNEFRARMNVLLEQYAAKRKVAPPEKMEARHEIQVNEEGMEKSSKVVFKEGEEDEELDEEIEDESDEYDSDITIRAHPMTKAGRFGTSPSTLQLPKGSLVVPTTALFADTSNKQLSEIAQKTFGGKGLPNSTATIRRPNLSQQTIPLEASHGRMGEMEANAYLAAIYPGAYASTMSALIEVRKRLGSEWLRNLMSRPSGPRILDAGSGGAAVLAWREVMKAEYAQMNPTTILGSERPPLGKSTVVTGSATLRHRASTLLNNTTFIPRLPDYDPSRDHPSLESSNPQARKQYDIIVAPYTLWSLKEDHMRKSQIQNFWSLLDPRGGVLILIEKGVPRGFELIAGARETLLKHHIASPGAEHAAETTTVDSANPNRFTHKETGMIIAPCTNHGKCPMYITAGKSQGRKDFCRFNQRFIRPPYLQRILGETDKNHEDISFSYVAFQRGKDARKDEAFVQGVPAADAAFEGYEEFEYIDEEDDFPASHPTATTIPPPPPKPPNLLTMPRAILPPIKRRGHVILDLCTPAGTIERWTVPKSFSKQAYRDARKSKWGDLWALGAKTRIKRNIRVGLRRGEGEEKAAARGVDEGDDDYAGGDGGGGAKGKISARERKKGKKYYRKEREGMAVG